MGNVMLVAGAIGWGILAFSAVTHIWHHARLAALLERHTTRSRPLAAALTIVEVVLAVGVPAALLAGSGVLTMLATAAAALGLLFVAWIASLLGRRSPLPCACSFSEAPTSIWSLCRAAAVCLVGLLAAVDLSTANDELVTALAAGLAAGAAIFVFPEALAWPDASRAVMRRIDAHQPRLEP